MVRNHSPRVDMHIHLGQSRDGAKITAKEIQELLDRYAISHAVVFPVDVSDPGPSFGVINTAVADFAAKDRRIIGFCRLDPRNPIAANRELVRAAKHGIRGVKLHPRSQEFSPANAEDLIAAIAKEKMPIMLHTSHEHRCHPLPWEGMFQRHKKTIFILAHSGKDAYKEAAAVALRCPNVYLDTTTLSYRRTQILLRRVGPDRLIFGSDLPYSHPALELLKFDLVLSDNIAARRKIFEENPKRILGGLP